VQAIQMLSIEQCKKILKKNGKTYTDEEVKKVRELLYQLGRLDYYLFTEKRLSDAKRNHLHKGIN
jgi:hypothetical protein